MPFHRAAYKDEDWWKHPEDGEELHVGGVQNLFSDDPIPIKPEYDVVLAKSVGVHQL